MNSELICFIFFVRLKQKYINLYNKLELVISMDKKTDELMEKCKNMDESTVMGSCQVLLSMMKDKDIKLEDDPDQSYMGMAENLKPKDVSKVLALALKVRESGDIKDVELKNAASRIIRAIEMS
jgi:hypothetical protein